MVLRLAAAMSLCVGCTAARTQLVDAEAPSGDALKPYPGESADGWPPPVPPPEPARDGFVGWPGGVAPVPPPPPPALLAGVRIAAAAGAMVDVPLRVAAPHLPDDCTGLVRLAYEREGVDLLAAADRSTTSGVTHIFRLAHARGALHQQRPEPGDLVFFRETYDRNRDGRLNDGYTHVAIVETVDVDGTVTYVHRGGRGVTRAKMNLHRPEQRHDASGRVINDWLRPKSRHAPAAFAAELFAGYGSARALAAE